jgi:iron complex transport system ATP-binding protein
VSAPVPLLELRGVSVTYGQATVLDAVDVALAQGEWLGLIGPNGAGKTSLIRAVAGLTRMTGTIALGGRDLAAVGRRERARLVAVVPQDPVTPPWMTVWEYVLLGRTPHLGPLGREGSHDLDVAAAALRRLELAAFRDRRLGTLSGGERQRVVVARALVQEASVVLLDEPTAALDIGHQQQALELLDALRGEQGLTLVAAMHDLTLAAQYVDRMVLLREGRIVADGVPGDVLTEALLAAHYDASVEVVERGGTPAVLPRRSRSEA